MSNASLFREAIRKLNDTREKTGINRNGKLYSMVKDRVELFRSVFGSEYGIVTTVDYSRGFDPGSVIVARAEIINGAGTYATGHAMDFVGRDEVTTLSAIEAAETSAIGRALAAFGFHGGEYASANEMERIPVKAENRVAAPVAPQPVPVQNAPTVTAVPQDWHIPNMQNINQLDWANEVQRVADSVASINDQTALSMYYASLNGFIRFMENNELELRAELSAIFNTRRDEIKSEMANNGARR